MSWTLVHVPHGSRFKCLNPKTKLLCFVTAAQKGDEGEKEQHQRKEPHQHKYKKYEIYQLEWKKKER